MEKELSVNSQVMEWAWLPPRKDTEWPEHKLPLFPHLLASDETESKDSTKPSRTGTPSSLIQYYIVMPLNIIRYLFMVIKSCSWSSFINAFVHIFPRCHSAWIILFKSMKGTNTSNFFNTALQKLEWLQTYRTFQHSPFLCQWTSESQMGVLQSPHDCGRPLPLILKIFDAILVPA